MVLGLIFLTIGVVLLASGIYSLTKGVTTDKRGNELSGGAAQAMSIIRLVGGVLCVGFALYKMLAG